MLPADVDQKRANEEGGWRAAWHAVVVLCYLCSTGGTVPVQEPVLEGHKAALIELVCSWRTLACRLVDAPRVCVLQPQPQLHHRGAAARRGGAGGPARLLHASRLCALGQVKGTAALLVLGLLVLGLSISCAACMHGEWRFWTEIGS